MIESTSLLRKGIPYYADEFLRLLAEAGLEFRFADLPGQCLVLFKNSFEEQQFFNLAEATGLQGAFSG